MLTQECLKELLSYNPETGLFTRNVSVPGTKVGAVAGCEHKYTENLSYNDIQIHGKSYKAHRLAFLYMNGKFPDADVDHIDGNGLNNAWVNLREVDKSANCRNKAMYANNSSGVPGVSFYSRSNKWRVAINITPGKKRHIGYYDTLLDAVAARMRAESEHNYHQNHGRKAA